MGFKCILKGYVCAEKSPDEWLVSLEKQVAYLGALCANKLISKDAPTEAEIQNVRVLRSDLFKQGE